MEIKYITTDLDFESKDDLNIIVQELGDDALPSHNGWIKDKYLVALASSSMHSTPEKTLSEFCDMIEGLSNESKKMWFDCEKRVADIAFESGEHPNNLSCDLSEKIIGRLNRLKLSVTITIYPIGHST